MSDKEEKPEKKPYADKDSVPPGRLSVEEYAVAKKEKRKRDSENYIEKNNLTPDFSHWAKATSWTCTEMIFLVNGVDPENGLKNDIYKTALEYNIDPFVTIEKQLKLTKRAQNDEDLAPRNPPISSCDWCKKMEIPVPFELLSLCVDSTKHKLAHDTELEEARKKAEEKLSSSAKEVLEASKTKDLGEQKEENLLRLIGILKNMFADKKVIEELKKDPKAFKNQKDLSNYISGEYAEDHPNKGLEKTSVDETFSSANKVLKDDENP